MCLALLFFAVISPGCFKVEKIENSWQKQDPRAEKCANWLSDACKFSLNEYKDIFIAHEFLREIAQTLNKDETF